MTTKALQEAAWAALPLKLEPYELERRRAFLHAHVAPGQAVLDLGCGEGAFTALLAGWGAEPVGIEVAEEALRRARARHAGLDFRLVEPGGGLPLADASVELCWASEVLAHVADTAGLLNEVRRVLRPRGTLLVTTPYHGSHELASIESSQRRQQRARVAANAAPISHWATVEGDDHASRVITATIEAWHPGGAGVARRRRRHGDLTAVSALWP